MWLKKLVLVTLIVTLVGLFVMTIAGLGFASNSTGSKYWTQAVN